MQGRRRHATGGASNGIGRSTRLEKWKEKLEEWVGEGKRKKKGQGWPDGDGVASSRVVGDGVVTNGGRVSVIRELGMKESGSGNVQSFFLFFTFGQGQDILSGSWEENRVLFRFFFFDIRLGSSAKWVQIESGNVQVFFFHTQLGLIHIKHKVGSNWVR